MQRLFRLSLAVLLAAVLPASAGFFGSATFPSSATFPVSATVNTTVDSVVITGAGESSANGIWIDSGSFNGHRYYIKFGKGIDPAYWTLKYNSSTGWTLTADQNANIAGGIGADDLYKSSSIGDGTPDVAYPWLVTQWYVTDSPVALPVPTFSHGRAPGYPFTNAPTQPLPEYDGITNVQKLSLSPDSPVGTQVSVSDGFYVSGTDYPIASILGFFAPTGATVNDRPEYANKERTYYSVFNSTWILSEGQASDPVGNGQDVFIGDNGTNPWDCIWSGGALGSENSNPTLTHPAIQQFNAPSTAQGGVAVLGGTQDGVYIIGIGLSNGKAFYKLLGSGDSDPDITLEVSWAGQWNIFNQSGTGLYYSLSDTLTPDLATNWKNASDDSPASITVTSVSVADLVAGVWISNAGTSVVNGPYPVSGNGTGLNAYTTFPLDTGASIFAVDTQWGLSDSNGDYYKVDPRAHAFPWQEHWSLNTDGTNPIPTFIRDNVAAESNWGAVSP